MGPRKTLVVWCVALVLAATSAYPQFPANEYVFSIEREELLQAEEKYQAKDSTLTPDEQIVDHFLAYLKWKEFQAEKDGDFPPMRPIEEQLPIILNSQLFAHLKTLPKGGNMHTHENHQVSKERLLEIVYNSTDFEHLWILPEDHPTAPWTLDFFITPPVGERWVQVKGNDSYTLDKVLPHQTLLGILDDTAKSRPTDSGMRWREMNPLWGRGSSQLIANLPIKIAYIEEMLRSSLEEGVQYLETRKSMYVGEHIYVLDPAANETNGKRIIDENDGEMDVTLVTEIVANFTEAHPEFIDLRRIIYTTRSSGLDNVRTEADRATRMHEKYPDKVVGFDLVGEEDAGNSHLFFIEPLTELYDPATELPKVPLYMHTAETNWAEDLITARNDEDPVATIQNVYEAILLGVKRIGHGLGFIKHPYLLELIKERGIAIESCVVSNQILGYMADLRNHPALSYYRRGIPVVLGPDDPGTFGLDYFTLDWYQAYVGWGLDLADLKQFAMNSLNYSSMSSSEKQAAIDGKWKPKWEEYIAEKKDVACGMNFTHEAPTFGMLFPKYGAKTGTTHVNIFGRHFERAICKGVRCKFGGEESVTARYVSQNHVICEAPEPEMDDSDELEVSVQVSFDGGENYFDHSSVFVYKFDPVEPDGPDGPDTPVDSAHNIQSLFSLVITAFMTGYFLKF